MVSLMSKTPSYIYSRPTTGLDDSFSWGHLSATNYLPGHASECRHGKSNCAPGLGRAVPILRRGGTLSLGMSLGVVALGTLFPGQGTPVSSREKGRGAVAVETWFPGKRALLNFPSPLFFPCIVNFCTISVFPVYC